MARSSLCVAIVHEVFHEPDGPQRLRSRLVQAREAGAVLALLPELPLNPWAPVTRTARDEDAEPRGGERQRMLADAAREIGIGVQGGAIVRDDTTGRRFNRALLFDANGDLVATYDKLHLPSEEGFWESDHYEPGLALPQRIDAFGVPLGLQICSDVQRPALSNWLGAMGVEAILAPRATPPESYERWRTVLRAIAITSTAYVISVNRSKPEGSAPIGGPSVAIAPDGEVLVETTASVTTVRLERDRVSRARRDYPGYLAVRADLYSRAWSER